MKVIDPYFEIIDEPNILKRIELCGRVCYKSEDRISEDSAKTFVDNIIKRGHTSVLEHAQIEISQDEFSRMYHETAFESEGYKNYGLFDRMTANSESRIVLNCRDFVSIGGTSEHLQNKNHYSEDFLTVRFICDRGISHEIVRHRKLSFSQESTRYVNYKDKDMEFIRPVPFEWAELPIYENAAIWENACRQCEEAYKALINNGATPQEARTVLNNSVKTEIIVSGKTDWWKHMLNLRLDKGAHPQMRYLMEMLNKEVKLV